MQDTTVDNPISAPSPTAPAAPKRRAFRPVTFWATIGSAALLLEFFVLCKWVASGNAKPTPAGATPMPGWMTSCLSALQVVSVITWLVCYYFVLFRPWLRHRRISADGLLLLAVNSLFWQDPLGNVWAPYFMYNAHLINFGSWVGSLPGTTMPNANRVVSPIVLTFTTYGYILLGSAAFGCWSMRKFRRRFSRVGNFGLIMFAFGLMVIMDFLLELTFMRIGYYCYPGVPGPKLFGGHYYQLPFVHAALWGGCWTAITCLRFFRDQHGRTVVERGADSLQVSAKARTFLRLLAVVGFVNTAMAAFNLACAATTMYHNYWPKDIIERSYFTQVCGPGTDYACEGPGVPVPHGGSAHLDLNGNLMRPKSP